MMVIAALLRGRGRAAFPRPLVDGGTSMGWTVWQDYGKYIVDMIWYTQKYAVYFSLLYNIYIYTYVWLIYPSVNNQNL